MRLSALLTGHPLGPTWAGIGSDEKGSHLRFKRLRVSVLLLDDHHIWCPTVRLERSLPGKQPGVRRYTSRGIVQVLSPLVTPYADVYGRARPYLPLTFHILGKLQQGFTQFFQLDFTPSTSVLVTHTEDHM